LQSLAQDNDESEASQEEEEDEEGRNTKDVEVKLSNLVWMHWCKTTALLVVLKESQLRTTMLDRNLWQIPTCDVLRKKVADLPDMGICEHQREKPTMQQDGVQ